MAGKAELGKTFLEEVLGKLPDHLRSQASTILSSPEAQTALEHAGSRVSPLDEERTQLNELRTSLGTTETRLTDWKNRLANWKTTQETDFSTREEALRTREAAGGNADDPPPAPTPAAAGATMTKEEIAGLVGEILAPREAAYVSYVADATKFSMFHFQNFKETLDVQALVRHPQIGELGVRGVYELVHKDKIDAMNVATAKAAEEAIRADERQKIAASGPVDMPYLIGEGSPLDVLTMDPAQRPKGDPAAAARMYDQLVSGRQ